MSIKKIILLIIVLLVVGFLCVRFIKTPVESPIIEEQKEQNILKVINYINPENDQKLEVSYDKVNNVAMIYPNTEGQVVFNATTSASGVKYINDKQDLVLWNKGDEISLYLNDSLIFNGFEEKN